MELDLGEMVAALPGDALDASHVAISGPDRVASSAFDVDSILANSAAFAVAALDRLGEQRGVAVPDRTIDLEHLLAFATAHVEVGGEPVPAWADLSGVYPTRDGRHLQVHCNFEHHAEGVVRRLGCGPDRDSVASAIAERSALELEAELIEDGMIGAVVRALDEWAAHPHAAATEGLPLATVERVGDGDPIPVSPSDDAAMSGLRVLDCSRVLAGPVSGQILAGFGADVLRLGADHLPSVPVGVMSTGFGKRNASLDVRTDTGARTMDQLLAEADVWIDAYRPGAFDELGFPVERVVAQRPGLVVVQISAFDWVGPWAGRRGFDSIVQSTTGLRWAGGEFARDRDGSPSHFGPIGLPVQALDYATGFLAAGVAASLVDHQRRVGGSWLGRVSL
ncbi:CoA transferase, partial [Ilumatobacter sp.]|uniref:CoA transferase n=1 Tax=Ilumatobacter sp. TaxID=1967498 RepID=UPI003C3B6FB6